MPDPYSDPEGILGETAKPQVNQKSLGPQFSRLPSGFPQVFISWLQRRTDRRLTRHSLLNPLTKPSSL